MPDDSLTKPIEDWTPSDIENLRGASESEYLELKGDKLDINSPARRPPVPGQGRHADDELMANRPTQCDICHHPLTGVHDRGHAKYR